MKNKLDQFQIFAPIEDHFKDRKNALIYTRVSTKEQADTNTSLSTQKKHCEAYAQKNGFNVVEYFGGIHESAKSDDRIEFKRMIKYAKQNNSIGYIIVYSYDRFSRTGSSAAQISTELLAYGVQVKAVTQEVDTKSASGKFQQNLFYMFSQFDNELRRDKTITAMSDLVRKGYWPWSPPRGYVNKNKYQKAVDWKIEITKEGELLKKAFHWKLKGIYSNTEIAAKLGEIGLKINDKRLHEIFRNPFYCGILVCKIIPGEVIEGRHPKIVSQEDFLKINKVNSSQAANHSLENDNLPLKHFIHCKKCKTPLTGFLVKKKGLYYYKCRTNGCSCTKSATQLHTDFRYQLQKYQVDAKYQDIVKEVMIYTYDSITKEIQQKEVIIRKQISENKSKLEAIEERFAIGEINKELYTKFASKYNKEIESLEVKLLNPTMSSSNLQKAIDRAHELSSKLTELWTSGDAEQKRQLQKLVFPDGLTYDKEKDRVQTNRVNSIFSSIPLIVKDLDKTKSGEPINFDQFSARVTSSGFKPETS